MTLSDIYKPKNFPDRTNERRRESWKEKEKFRVLRIFTFRIFFYSFPHTVDRPPSRSMDGVCMIKYS